MDRTVDTVGGPRPWRLGALAPWRSSWTPGVAVLVLVLGAAGCRSGLERAEAPSIPLRERYAATADAAPVQGGWVAAFDDPVLVALVAEAWAANPDLVAAAARLEQAEARAAQVGAARLPALDLDASAARARSSFQLPTGERVPIYANDYQVGLGLSWEADVWGRLAAAARAEAAAAVAARSDLVGAYQSLAGRVARAWYRVSHARMQVALAADFRDSARTTVGFLQRRFADGRSPAVDLRAARTQLARAEADLVERRRALDAAQRELELLLGRYPAAAVAGADLLPPLPAPPPAGLPATLLLRRPDLQAALARLRAADARLASAEADLLPRISLTARGGYRSGELSDLIEPENLVWNLVANLLQPLFDGGRRRAVAAERLAQARELAAQYAGAALAALREVEQALAAGELLRAQLAAQGEAVAEGDELTTELDRRYAEGLADGVVVLAERRQALARRQALVALRLEALLNRIDLHLALGGSALDSQAAAITRSVDEDRPEGDEDEDRP